MIAKPFLTAPAKILGAALALVLLVLIGLLLTAPYVYADVMALIDPHAIMTKTTPPIARGRMADDYWVVEQIGPATFAIGEPRYYQQNYSYLLLGSKRALLFDAGSGTRDIAPVVARLTHLPVTVLPSHLHYDHLAGITSFHSIALIDLPETRADVRDGWFEPGRYEFLGMMDHLATPRFRVTEWVKPGSWIDLGGRRIRVLSTPGHTPTSASLYDPQFGQLFAGDYMYPGPLYAQLPGASRSAYRSTASTLLTILPPDTIIWSAHCCRADGGIRAPWMGISDLKALQTALDRIADGSLPARGFYPRAFPLNGQNVFLTGFRWTNR